MVPHQPCLLLSAVVSSSAYVAYPNLRDDDCLMIILIPSEEFHRSIIRLLSSESLQTVIGQSSESHQAVFWQSSGSHQGVMRKSSGSHQTVNFNHLDFNQMVIQMVIRQSSGSQGSHQTVNLDCLGFHAVVVSQVESTIICSF